MTYPYAGKFAKEITMLSFFVVYLVPSSRRLPSKDFPPWNDAVSFTEQLSMSLVRGSVALRYTQRLSDS